MIKRLVIFGDSYAYGDTLDEATRLDKCYAGVVANYFGWDFVNLGIPGGSQESSKRELYRFQLEEYSKSNNLILHGLTLSNRYSWFGNTDLGNNFICNAIPQTVGEYKTDQGWCDQMKDQWVKYCHSEEWEHYNDWQAIQLFDMFSQQTAQTVLQYYTYGGLLVHQCLIDELQVLPILDNNQSMFTECQHLTEEGNQVVAKHFIDYIEQNVL